MADQRSPEHARREREELFRRLSSAGSEGITIMRDDQVAEANDAFSRLFGYAPGGAPGRSLLDFIAPESRDAVARQITLATEKPYDARGRRKDGSTFDIELTIRRIMFQGRPALGCLVRDITERKEID